jgi:hypothetical protein
VRATSIVALVSGLFVSCSPSATFLLSHKVTVPTRFEEKASSEVELSDAARYKRAYEEAWGKCVSRFSGDIDYKSTVFDRAGSGWPAAVWGYEDGYVAAEARIHSIRDKYGSAQAQVFLRQAVVSPNKSLERTRER